MTQDEARKMLAFIGSGSLPDLVKLLSALIEGDFSGDLSDVELGYLDGATPGTAVALKAVVTNSSLSINGLNNIGLSGALTFGTGGSINLDAATAAVVTGTATLNKMAGKLTTTALTTTTALVTITLANSMANSACIAHASVANGTNSQGRPYVSRVQPSSGQLIITLGNNDGTALNGTLVVSYMLANM